MTLTPPVVDAARGPRRARSPAPTRPPPSPRWLEGAGAGAADRAGPGRADTIVVLDPAAAALLTMPRRRRRVKLDVGCSMSLRALWATPAVLMLRPRSGEGQWVIAERYQIDPSVPVSEFTDAHGNLCQRIVVPEGAMTISVEATVDTADEIDVDVTAPRVPIDEVPDWALQFLLPSRYCQSDLVFTNAVEITKRRAARLPAGRGDPVVDRARGPLRVRHQLGRDVGRRHALQPRRRVPRLRPPRHRPVPQPRHPGAHGRRLPPRPRPDGPARLVRGLRRRPLVHVRRHPARTRGATG